MRVAETKLSSQMRAERLHTITLGCVMTGCNESDAALAREMKRLLRCFTGDVRVGAESHGFFEITLSCTRTPRYMPHLPS